MRPATLEFAKCLAEGSRIPVTDEVMPLILDLSARRFPVRVEGSVARVPHHLQPLAERMIYAITEPFEQHSIGWRG